VGLSSQSGPEIEDNSLRIAIGCQGAQHHTTTSPTSPFSFRR
jgi:hypothetical protein